MNAYTRDTDTDVKICGARTDCPASHFCGPESKSRTDSRATPLKVYGEVYEIAISS